MSELSSASETRIQLGSADTAISIFSIGWFGGILAQFLTSTVESWWMWVCTPALAVAGLAFALKIGRSHTRRAVAHGTTVALELADREQHG